MYNKIKYIFYASDMDTLPSKGHFFKMDEGRAVALQIKNGLGNCRLMKFSDYQGEVIDADSVGIVFPAHTWGISLAVYSFISHIKVSKDTYVYAVSVGERVQADSFEGSDTNNALKNFARLFIRRGLGNMSDIFVSCHNIKRHTDTTEEYVKSDKSTRYNILQIMRGILCYSADSLKKYETVDSSSSKKPDNAAYERVELPSVQVRSDIRLDNIFLDENILAGVRLCRVM
ncbi:MAG: hypothetical protein ACI4D8_04075 [Wujia sp.]